MTFHLPRKVTQLDNPTAAPTPPAAYRDRRAYVLLGEPGGGKTEALRHEAQACRGRYITARDFIDLDLPAREAEQGLFIDALDEVRAGGSGQQQRQALSAIRQKLDALGRPNFRLTCRAADWLGRTDAESLNALYGKDAIVVLRLEPLTEEEIAEVARDHTNGQCSANAFVEAARTRGLLPLMSNPMFLKLLLQAVAEGVWPETRTDAYRMAAEQLVVEHDEAHYQLTAPQPPVGSLLLDAGLLSATMLLSGREAVQLGPPHTTSANDFNLAQIAPDLALPHAQRVLGSKLFTADGSRRLPLHRTMAEFLGAQSLAYLIQHQQLPITRVLALMCGQDGGIVDPLRGLHAWLASVCPPVREVLVERDPLSVVLYGDVAHFSTIEKTQTLHALQGAAEASPWFRRQDWRSLPFGALADTAMTAEFADALASSARSRAHQAYLSCVLDAVTEAPSPLTALQPALEQVVRDASFFMDLRLQALRAWLKCPPLVAPAAKALLQDVHEGRVEDEQDALKRALMEALYPAHLTPAMVSEYLDVPARNVVGSSFADELVTRTPAGHLPDLVDALAEQIGRRPKAEQEERPTWLFRSFHRFVHAALVAHGDELEPTRIRRWLVAGLDQYGMAVSAWSQQDHIGAWLTENPSVQKALYLAGLREGTFSNEPAARPYWQELEVLHKAKQPPDWYQWLLEVADEFIDERIVRHCFDEAAYAVKHLSPAFDIRMEHVEAWVATHATPWPDADDWRVQAWSSPIDSPQAKSYRRRQGSEAQRLAQQVERRAQLKPLLSSLRSGVVPAWLMHRLATVGWGRYMDIQGDTPLAKLQDFLQGSPDEAQMALDRIHEALERPDLPTVAEILKAGADGMEPYLRPACLMAAQHQHERDPSIVQRWPDDLAQRMVAIWLTHGMDDIPRWYLDLLHERPDLIAPIYTAYASQRLKNTEPTSITDLWTLQRHEAFQPLARAVLPALLTAFPIRAVGNQRTQLLRALLPAALRWLDPTACQDIATRKLLTKSLDAPQRIAWLLVRLVLVRDNESWLALRDYAGTSQKRKAQAAEVLVEWTDEHPFENLPPEVLAGLFRVLAPQASPTRPVGGGIVSTPDRIRDLANQLLHQLANVGNNEVSVLLEELRGSPTLAPWKPALDYAKDAHTRLRRAASYQHASPLEVSRVLSKQAPANALDLAALAELHLREIGAAIRGDDANRPKQFWHFTKEGQPRPKIENDCRDVLLPWLRAHLQPLDVQTEKERSAHGDTRADLCLSTLVTGQRIAVPIEIKRGLHKDLWTAWRDQLDGRYTTDPDAQGVGIYLVLWFGANSPGKAGPRGERPRSATELESLLRAEIPAIDRQRLSVVVLDVSLTKTA